MIHDDDNYEILTDIETGELLDFPYIILGKRDKKVYLNLDSYNERIRQSNENPPAQRIYCILEFVNKKGAKESIEVLQLPKQFFPKTFDYFNDIKDMEKILLN